MKAVANAGPLIHLSWLDRLEMLQLFDELVVPVAVREEVLGAGPEIPGTRALREAFRSGWPVVQPVRDVEAVTRLKVDLDQGEAEAIVLMREVDADLILLDERRARHVAQRQGLPLTGTLGILRMAREHALVPAVLPLLTELRRRGFRISEQLVEEIRREESALEGA